MINYDTANLIIQTMYSLINNPRTEQGLFVQTIHDLCEACDLNKSDTELAEDKALKIWQICRPKYT